MHATYVVHLTIHFLNILLKSDKQYNLRYETPLCYFVLLPFIFLYVLSPLFSNILYFIFA
jgi:hypothetical protein